MVPAGPSSDRLVAPAVPGVTARDGHRRQVSSAIERLSRPRWSIPEGIADRSVGAIVSLLALSALWPMPRVNIVPGMVIVSVAIAYLQKDGLLLAVARVAALLGFRVDRWTSAGAMMRWIGIG